jgi:MFS family permease
MAAIDAAAAPADDVPRHVPVRAEDEEGDSEAATAALLPAGEDADASAEGAVPGPVSGGASFARTVGRLLWRNDLYRLLWLSDVVNGLGDWFNYLAVVSLVTAEAGPSSSLAVAGLLLTRALPQTLLTPLVGWAADRYDRVVVMMASNLVLAAIVLLFLLPPSLPLLYTVSTLQAGLGAFYDPAQAGVTPAVVLRKDLPAANAIDTATWSTMLALGSFAGGIALRFLGSRACFLIDALSYVVSTLFLARLWVRLRERRSSAAAESNTAAKPAVGEPVGQDADAGEALVLEGDAPMPTSQPAASPAADTSARAMLAGVARFFWRNPAVFYLCFVKAADSISWGAMDVINIATVERVFAPAAAAASNTGAETEAETATEEAAALLLGMTYFAVAVGTAAGPLLARALPVRWVDPDRLRGMVVWVLLSFVLVAVGVGVQALVPTSRALFFTGTIVRCAGNAVNYVAASSFLQTVLPDGMRGRVFALESGFNMAAMTSAQLAAGALMDRGGWSPGDATRGMAVVCVVLLAAWCAHFVLAQRAYTRLYAREARLLADPAAMASIAA